MNAIILKVFIDKNNGRQYRVGERVTFADSTRLKDLEAKGLVKSLEQPKRKRK